MYSTAIVTGASRGLGLAVGRSFAARGLNVVLASRTEPPSPVDDAEWVRADVSRGDDIRALFAHTRDRFGSVDVLVNNAGIGWSSPFVEWTEDEIRSVVELNFTGLMLCCREALPQMLEQRRGLIVNVASDLAMRFTAGMSVYTATKFGVRGFSGSLLREVKDSGVKVVTVMPGVIDTSFGGFAGEGSRGEEHGIPPAHLAEEIARLLDQPPHLVVDELVVPPTGQSGF